MSEKFKSFIRKELNEEFDPEEYEEYYDYEDEESDEEEYEGISKEELCQFIMTLEDWEVQDIADRVLDFLEDIYPDIEEEPEEYKPNDNEYEEEPEESELSERRWFSTKKQVIKRNKKKNIGQRKASARKHRLFYKKNRAKIRRKQKKYRKKAKRQPLKVRRHKGN